MNFKRVLTFMLISVFLLTLPVAQLMATKSSLKSTPVLWIWDFQVGTPYSEGSAIKVDLRLMAMDNFQQKYPINVLVQLRDSMGNLVFLKDYGSIKPTYSKVITLIENQSTYSPGMYHAEIKGVCTPLGKSETVTRTVQIN